MPLSDAAEIASQLLARRRDRTVVVGIDGFGGSGKSTFAGTLAGLLESATIIPLDDFIIKDRVDDDSWEQVWDRARLVDEVITPIREGKSISYRPFDWSANGLGDPKILPESAFLLIEGITTLHPDLRDRFDFCIWIETPIEVSKMRGAARDAGNENESRWDRWAQNDLTYFALYQPKDCADAIVDNG